MIHNYKFGNVNEALPTLMDHLLVHGDEFGSRAGRTKEMMHVGITLTQPWQREIVLPERKANLAAQIVETMWVLSGRNDVAGLAHYLPRAADFSDDGVEWRAGYGQRLRNFGGDSGGPAATVQGLVGVDQIEYVVRTLKTSPGSRQAVASIWDPAVDTQPGKDIACNNWLSFSSRKGYLDLHVAIRSNDIMWGWSGINAFEWSALLEIVAGLTGLMVGGLHFSTTSFHLYDQHWAKAGSIAKQFGNFRYSDSPRFSAGQCWNLQRFDDLARQWFQIEGLIRTGQKVGSAVQEFPEPMMRSWLRVLQWYWSGDDLFLEPYVNTRLYHAALVGLKPAGKPQPAPVGTIIPEPGSLLAARQELDGVPPGRVSFLEFVNALHAEKHAAYGDSWKRRGEMGILGNIARKVDRLESGADTSDETQTDTAIDLLVYLLKYRDWLDGGKGDPAAVEVGLGEYEKGYDPSYTADIHEIVRLFDTLGVAAGQKVNTVEEMLAQAYILARSRY